MSRRLSRYLLSLSLVLALLAACLTFVPATPADEPPPHLALARQLLAALSPDNTSYRHRGWIAWGEDRSSPAVEAHTDCSGLLNGLLEKTGSPALPRLSLASRRGIPKAIDYLTRISAQDGFRRIETLAEVRPGDILAVKSAVGSRDTGHVMLVDAAPVLRESETKPIVAGTRQWEVAIIDSTKSPHGEADSRFGPNGQKRNGVGRGIVRLYADDAGRPVGFSWSLLSTSRFVSAADRPLAIGRPAAPTR